MKSFWNWLNNFFLPKEQSFPKYATGVLPDPGDYRTVELGAVQASVGAPTSYIGLESQLLACGFFNQQMLGICVPSAIFKLTQAYIYRKTGKIIPLHPRFAYKLCKKFDGFSGVEGTIPRIGALIAVKFGAGTTETLSPDTSVKMSEYLGFEANKAILDDARRYKMPGFASVAPTKEAIMEAIYQNGAICGATPVGRWYDLPLLSTPFFGDHYTIWYRYETLADGDLKVYIWNSWGGSWLSSVKNWIFPGRGYFLYSEYKNKIRDIIAFLDIPPDFLSKIQKMPFYFAKQLRQGMTHPDVKELQKMLNEDPDTTLSLEGVGSGEMETNYFGPATLDAMKRWQTKHNLPSTGFFGPMSITEANKRIAPSSKLEQWALAIQEHEGYFPGSRSYRNNNPGNLKYFGFLIPYARGHDAQNFCIFETYEKGFDALKMLLTRACTGLSEVYSPDDTLYQFFEKYAPSYDENDPKRYAEVVAGRLGISASTPIKNLV